MPNRQLPYPQFVAEIRAESEQDSTNHAVYMGISLAEVLVASHKKVDALKPAEVESFRKKYQVAKGKVQDFLNSAKASYAAEFYWANSHT